jgi:glycosyltransferase involved in cell wall biosynthesis
MQSRVLAVGHDAYRAGAQIEFLHVLRWLSGNYDAQLSGLLRSGGELLSDYETVLPTRVLERDAAMVDRSVIDKAMSRVERQMTRRRALVESGSADLIYGNSSATASLAARLATEAGCPVVLRVHELEMSMQRFAADFDDVGHRIDRFIAVSDAVKQNLVAGHEINPDRIDVVRPASELTAPAPPPSEQSRLRAELGIPPDAFVVGGCGTADWRKAPDMYLLVAKALTRRETSRPVRFLWLGGDPQQLNLVRYDIDRLGLRDEVSFIGPQADPAPYFEFFDAFMLTSREDPFPLVCLETAALGVPTVCFADAGGMPEFVESDAGYIVPYLDIEAAADRLVALANSAELTRELGARAAAKVAERHAIQVIGPQVAAVLDECLGRASGPATSAAPKGRAAV